MRIFGIMLSAALLGLVAPADAQTSPASGSPALLCVNAQARLVKGEPPCSIGTLPTVPPKLGTAVTASCVPNFPPKETLLQGTTTLSYIITATGDVRDIIITGSSGSSYLDNTTIACTQRKKYIPATRDGVPVEYPWSSTTRWKLQ